MAGKVSPRGKAGIHRALHLHLWDTTKATVWLSPFLVLRTEPRAWCVLSMCSTRE